MNDSCKVLHVLSETLNVLIASTKSGKSPQDIANVLASLELQVKSISVPHRVKEKGFPRKEMDMTDLIELYQLTTLVYLARISETTLRTLHPPEQLAPTLERAFELLDQVQNCQRRLPLVILACEADTDDRRLTMLKLIDRTQEVTLARTLRCFKLALETIWAQRDLHADEDLYLDPITMLRTVISSNKHLPNLT